MNIPTQAKTRLEWANRHWKRLTAAAFDDNFLRIHSIHVRLPLMCD